MTVILGQFKVFLSQDSSNFTIRSEIPPTSNSLNSQLPPLSNPCYGIKLLSQIEDYSIIMDSYDQVVLFQYFIYPKNYTQTAICLNQNHFYIEIFDQVNMKNNLVLSREDSNLQKYIKQIELRRLSSKQLVGNYILLIAEIEKNDLDYCYKYNTTYISVFDCNMKIIFKEKPIQGSPLNKTKSSTNMDNEGRSNADIQDLQSNSKEIYQNNDIVFYSKKKEYLVKRNFYLRFVNSILGENIALNTVNSLLYSYEYKREEPRTENTETAIQTSKEESNSILVTSQPQRYSNITSFSKCDYSKCQESQDISFLEFNHDTIYFKLIIGLNSTLTQEKEYDISKIILIVDKSSIEEQSFLREILLTNEQTSQSQMEFLTENNIIESKWDTSKRDKKIEFYQDITHLVNKKTEYYQLTLLHFPKSFKLLFTINVKDVGESSSEERIVLRVDNINPFKIYKIIDTGSQIFWVIVGLGSLIGLLIISTLIFKIVRCLYYTK